jgi:hypothetical protein
MSAGMESKAEKLTRHCQAIKQGADRGIDWVRDVRQSSTRVDREADALIQKLRRMKNLAGRLGQAAANPVSVGFFGLSQAGKSYLISTMAAGNNGRLETVYDGQCLDFMKHVNPPGGGKEATGLVTRFTRNTEDTVAGFPIKLSIFSEIDLVKILGNSFFNDFNREKVKFNTDPEYINQLLADAENKAQAQATGGITEDDMVDLQDYFTHGFKTSMEPLKGAYWPGVIEFVPRLKAEDRARILSVLWGQIDELTSTYLLLKNALTSLSFAPVLFAPLTVLVNGSEQEGFSQQDSIMNVDMLGRLGKDNSDSIDVMPVVQGQTFSPVALPRSILAALTLEMIFPLVEKPVCEKLETVDLLDFPGYRGRLSIEDINGVREALKDNKKDPVSELLLRGKVAYLFERFTDCQEMNVLIVCTPSDKQSDVTSVGPVLTSWIEKTQGETVDIRTGKKPGLAWAITMFDKRINASLSHTEDLLQNSWGTGGLMQQALLERFGQYNWVHEWAMGQPFSNMFLVRKPREPVSFLELEDGSEIAVKAEYQAQLDLMRSTFSADTTIQKHFNDPAAIWDSMMSLNQGGVGLLSEHVFDAADLNIKLSRISEQVDNIVDDLVHKQFGDYFQAEGASEVEKKKAIVKEIVDSLKSRAPLIGELLYQLQPVVEHFRAIYLRSEMDNRKVEATFGQDPAQQQEKKSPQAVQIDNSMFDLNLDFSISEAPSSSEEPATPVKGQGGGSCYLFTRGVMQEWVKHLKEIPDRSDLMAYLGFSKKAVELLISELITAIDRLKLEQRLVEAISKTESQTSSTRHRLVERQTLVVSTIINDFLSSLGMNWIPVSERADSRFQSGRKIFTPADNIKSGQLPKIKEQPTPYTTIYLTDWLIALEKLIIANAGHSAGRDISPEQNEALGQLMRVIEGKE